MQGFDLMDAVVDELFDALEKKDKGMLKEALKALVLQIQDEDREQDQSSEEMAP